jgi:hypothetical protein
MRRAPVAVVKTDLFDNLIVAAGRGRFDEFSGLTVCVLLARFGEFGFLFSELVDDVLNLVRGGIRLFVNSAGPQERRGNSDEKEALQHYLYCDGFCWR